jgi:serine/threonine protein kinase
MQSQNVQLQFFRFTGRTLFGCVYTYWDPVNERFLAHKTSVKFDGSLYSTTDDPEREIMLLRTFSGDQSHPRFVQQVDFWSERGPNFVVYHSLQQHGGHEFFYYINEWYKSLGDGQRIPEADCRMMFLQVVDVLEELWRRNLFHGDLKLENLVIDEFKQIRCIDLGTCTQDRDENGNYIRQKNLSGTAN